MDELSLDLIKLLYLRFVSIFGEKFTRNHPDDNFIKIWWEDWYDGLAGVKSDHVKSALNHCRLNLDWPPSLAEFRRLCERYAGVPTWEESFNSAIRSDFFHPIVKQTYDKVGSWSMKTDKEITLRKKFREAYDEMIAKNREEISKQKKLMKESQVELLISSAQTRRKAANSWMD